MDQQARLTLVEATPEIRREIYRARHEVYAVEIGQHAANDEQCLTDKLDAANCYLAVLRGGELAGFVSITPPGDHGYSIDKYFDRGELPFRLLPAAFEIRLLTVLAKFRARDIAATLMLAAFRWIESRGGTQVVAIGRREVKSMYQKVGMRDVGLAVESGAVTYDLMVASTEQIRAVVDKSDLVDRIERRVAWQVPVSLRKPAPCFHGGAFFDAVGADFASLKKSSSIINADVLDAWFDPAPQVLEALQSHLPWLLKTSPPTACEGLVAAISRARGVAESCILPGAGSSDLMFRALPRWLSRESRVLILDPTYGEYAHILKEVVACKIERLRLRREAGYTVNIEEFREKIATGPDLVILVNPNSPTGTGLSAAEIESFLKTAPRATRFWVDETYVDYTGESVEGLVGQYENLVVCKSMSKAYALSGARVAYLSGPPHLLEELRAVTPPWVVSLLAQVAAVNALQEISYYQLKWQQTHRLRGELAQGLRRLGWDVFPGCANYLFAHLPENGPTANELVAACRRRGLFLRNASPMASESRVGERAVRIAVKDAVTNERILAILSDVLHEKRLPLETVS